MEAQPPNTRGARTFTLMPLKQGFVMSHITICSSCLQQILQSIVKANQGVSFLGHTNITKQVFDANKHEIATRVQPGAALALLVFFAQGVEVPD